MARCCGVAQPIPSVPRFIIFPQQYVLKSFITRLHSNVSNTAICFLYIKHIVIFIIIITFNIVNILNMLVPVMICVLLSQLQTVVFSFSKLFFS